MCECTRGIIDSSNLPVEPSGPKCACRIDSIAQGRHYCRLGSLGSARDIRGHHYWLGVLSVSTYSAWGVLVPNKAACVGVENDKMRVQG